MLTLSTYLSSITHFLYTQVFSNLTQTGVKKRGNKTKNEVGSCIISNVTRKYSFAVPVRQMGRRWRLLHPWEMTRDTKNAERHMFAQMGEFGAGNELWSRAEVYLFVFVCLPPTFDKCIGFVMGADHTEASDNWTVIREQYTSELLKEW